MCSIAAASLITTAVGTAIGAYGAYQGKKAEKKAKTAQAAAKVKQADIAEKNAARATEAAEGATTAGEARVALMRSEMRRRRGETRSALAAGGVRVDEGSALDVLYDSEFAQDLDAFLIRQEAGQEAEGHRVTAENFMDESDILDIEGTALRRGASDAGSASLTAGLGTLATGSAVVADRWYTYREKYNYQGGRSGSLLG